MAKLNCHCCGVKKNCSVLVVFTLWV